MFLKRIALVGAVSIALTGVWATAAQAMDPPGGGGPSCNHSNIDVSSLASNTGEDPTMKITIHDGAGCAIRAYVHCKRVLFHIPGGTYYHYGNSVSSGTTTADCGGNAFYGWSGYQWFNGETSAWVSVGTFEEGH